MESETMSEVPLSSKRKLSADEELEINLNLPEPPSKKAKRKDKKAKSSTSIAKPAAKSERNEDSGTSPVTTGVEQEQSSADATQATPKRGDHGIWIGNLPFTATKETLRDFLKEQGGIEASDVVRVHLPTTTVASAPIGKKTQNKGFAYIDFTSKVAMELALSLSEKLLSGRRVLIKNAKSFEGRPEKTDKPTEAVSNDKSSGREPTKKIFVGNLGFDVTKEDLAEHFSQAGEVEDIFMATFEDSGKCKGFAWLRFATIEAAEAAVKGFIFRDPPDEFSDGTEDEDDDKNGATNADEDQKKEQSAKAIGAKKRKRQKWFINRLNGRQLRCEFAEDAQTRYKKRFSKDPKATTNRDNAGIVEASNNGSEAIADAVDYQSRPPRPPRSMQPDKEQRREDRRKRHERLDARTVAPGKALANAPRASGAIVAGKGTKMTFDD